MRTISGIILTTLLVAGAASAQVVVEKRRPAHPGGELQVENSFGSVTVRGWDQSEVLVRGELAPGAEGLEFDGDQEGTYVDVAVPEAWFYATDDDSEYRTTLEIFAPFDSVVEVETVNASVEIVAIRNEVEVETVNGTVRVEGGATSVEIETMTGGVEVRAAGAPMSIATISGPVVLYGAAREVEVETVSAPVEVVGEDIEALQIESTSGTVTFRGTLAAEGHLEIETFSGDVTLVLPASVQAHFELTTFSGEIDSALGPKVGGGDRFTPHKKLRFTTGLRDFDVTVDTHSAGIILRVEGE